MRKKIYPIVNLAVLLLTILFFLLHYGSVDFFFINENAVSVIVFLLGVLVVHCVKAGRLYFALYGNEVRLKRYLKIYCKVTPVSIVIPFKMGEFFRMYCYGNEIRNILKGVVIVLLDRFMDTAALLIIIFVAGSFNGGNVNAVVFMLTAILLLLILGYYMFPGLYRFWKGYLLHAEVSEHKLWGLKMLENFQLLYKEAEEVITGRGVILFVLSLIAWAVEIGLTIIMNQLYFQSENYDVLMKYIMAAITGRNSAELDKFVFVSVIVLILGYFILTVFENVSRDEVRK